MVHQQLPKLPISEKFVQINTGANYELHLSEGCRETYFIYNRYDVVQHYVPSRWSEREK
jgi:hypothetical protein